MKQMNLTKQLCFLIALFLLLSGIGLYDQSAGLLFAYTIPAECASISTTNQLDTLPDSCTSEILGQNGLYKLQTHLLTNSRRLLQRFHLHILERHDLSPFISTFSLTAFLPEHQIWQNQFFTIQYIHNQDGSKIH